MPNLVKVVAQSRKEWDEEQKAAEQLDRSIGCPWRRRRITIVQENSQNLGRESRTMSAAARKEIAAAQRVRWAKWKAAQGKK